MYWDINFVLKCLPAHCVVLVIQFYKATQITENIHIKLKELAFQRLDKSSSPSFCAMTFISWKWLEPSVPIARSGGVRWFDHHHHHHHQHQHHHQHHLHRHHKACLLRRCLLRRFDYHDLSLRPALLCARDFFWAAFTFCQKVLFALLSVCLVLYFT